MVYISTRKDNISDPSEKIIFLICQKRFFSDPKKKDIKIRRGVQGCVKDPREVQPEGALRPAGGRRHGLRGAADPHCTLLQA